MTGIEGNYRSKIVKIDIPSDANIIFGMSHFIKTVEDLYETLITSSVSIRFGVAFCEASQQRLIRTDGNDENLIEMAAKAAFDVACGHNQIKQVPEVCRIFCATANPLEVIVAETGLGRGVMGVVDGEPPLGIEGPDEKEERAKFLTTIGYKR